jgi:hypothetical protein
MIEFARFGSRLGDHFRAVIVASPDADGPEVPGFALYHDAKRQFCFEYGRQAWDLGANGFRWCGRSCLEQNLTGYLQQVFG